MMMEEVLSLRQKYREIVSKLMTPGAIGMAVLLGSAAPVAANPDPAIQPQSPAQGERVSDRLAAIRAAVSEVGGVQTTDAAGEQRLAWGNWGGGFGFGAPWGNFGYGGPWNNWNNWRNGWHNWRNGWGNW